MPDNSPEYHRRWRAANLERSREIQKTHRDGLRWEALTTYSSNPPCCACCGEEHLEFLTLDHTEGGGNEERRAGGHRGGTAQYRWLRKHGWPEGYRVLCWNCNAALGAYGRCPHGTVRETIIRSPRKVWIQEEWEL